MAGDYLEFFDGSAHQFGTATGNIAVRGAVEAVATNTVIFIIFIIFLINESII